MAIELRDNRFGKCHVNGCELAVIAKGYCNPHYHRIRNHGKLTKTCKHCGAEYDWVPYQKTGQYHCPDCYVLYHQVRDITDTFRKHGLTMHQYIWLYEEQNGRCKLCHYQPIPQGDKKFQLEIDHDHSCCDRKNKQGGGLGSCGNCIRGLLCHNCNTMIGQYENCLGDLKIQEFEDYLNSRINFPDRFGGSPPLVKAPVQPNISQHPDVQPNKLKRAP